jgi:hypothetical protein
MIERRGAMITEFTPAFRATRLAAATPFMGLGTADRAYSRGLRAAI